MFFAGNRSHAIPLFVSANVLPLNMLYFETVFSLMRDISTNSAPQNICDLFICSSGVHSYNTRFSDVGNLYVNKSRLRIRLNSLSIFGAKIWNCLKPDLHKIHQFLLAVLGDEDDTPLSRFRHIGFKTRLAVIISKMAQYHCCVPCHTATTTGARKAIKI